MNPLHQISDPWKSVQPASVDNELICNVNYIKHPPRQHLCVSVFNLKRLSLKMSFSIKSLDSIYISCIRVNLCLTQSINHCQGVLCLYLSSSPIPLPSSSHPCTCYVQNGAFRYRLHTAPVLRPKVGHRRRDPGSGRCAAWAGVAGWEVLLCFCQLLRKGLPKGGVLSLGGSFPSLKESMAEGCYRQRPGLLLMEINMVLEYPDWNQFTPPEASAQSLSPQVPDHTNFYPPPHPICLGSYLLSLSPGCWNQQRVPPEIRDCPWWLYLHTARAGEVKMIVSSPTFGDTSECWH